jgi:hypothetical protein
VSLAGTGRRVLVARLDNCGDVLLTGPAVRAVAEAQQAQSETPARPGWSVSDPGPGPGAGSALGPPRARPVAERPGVVMLCGPRGRAAAELLPGVDQVLELRAPWIEPDPMPVRATDADRLVDQVRQLDIGEALILGSSHQSPLPLALLLRWAGVGCIAAVSHEHAGSLLDVRIKGDPDVHEVERNLRVAEALGYPRPADERLRVELARPPAPAAWPRPPRAAAPLTADAPGAPRAPGALGGRHGDGSGGRRGGRHARHGRRRGDDDVGATDEARDPVLGRFMPGRYVVVHPGATAPARTLPTARWRAVTECLAAAGWTVVVTGSRQERRLTAMVTGHHRGVVDLGGRTTFRALGRLVEGAAAFVGGNTGPLHLAAAVGTPVVAVFPPTVPLQRWRPWRVPHVVLGDQGVRCAGCRARECPLPEQVCLAGVGPEAVGRAVEALTSGSAPMLVDLRGPRDEGPAHAAPDRPVVTP